MEKMIFSENIPRIRERGVKKMVEEVNSSMINSIYSKNLCKCHEVHLPSTTATKNPMHII
jgi:hypothetical protein